MEMFIVGLIVIIIILLIIAIITKNNAPSEPTYQKPPSLLFKPTENQSASDSTNISVLELFQIQRDNQIIEESKSIIANSKNIETIISRYDLIITLMKGMSNFETSGKLKAANDGEVLGFSSSVTKYESLQSKAILDWLDNDFVQTKESLTDLKLKSAKLKRLQKVIFRIRKYSVLIKDCSYSTNELSKEVYREIEFQSRRL